MRSRIKIIILLFFICCKGYCQEYIPPVSLRKHPLTDIYFFSSGGLVFPIEVRSLVTGGSILLGGESTVGIGVGFHMPNKSWMYVLKSGYHYCNFFYTDTKYPGGLSTHWLNMDLRVIREFIGGGMMYGIESNLLLGKLGVNNIPLNFLGLSHDCFNPATLSIYFGICITLIDNLSFETKYNINLIRTFDRAKTGVLLFSTPGVVDERLSIDIGIRYRFFTSGKRINK